MTNQTSAQPVVYASASQRVSETTFLAVIWTFTGISAVFLISRLSIRFKVFKKFMPDDFLAISAWGMLLAFAITFQIKASILYWQFDIVEGKRAATPEFLAAYGTFMPFIVVWNVLFYCCLWSVKFSFLMFFRGLNSNIQVHRRWWWVVFLLTWAGLAASIGDIDYGCSLSSIQYIYSECRNAGRVHFDARTLYANMAADIFTDMLILSIPITILWNVQMRLAKKLILYGIFSATLVIIIVAIVRTALVQPRPEHTSSIDWLYLWSAVEMGVAIMISCVASFRQLYLSQNNQHLFGAPKISSAGRNLLTFLRSIPRWGSTSRSDSHSSEGKEEMSDDMSQPKQTDSHTQLHSMQTKDSV